MDSLQPIVSDSYFTNKKTMVSYGLAVLIFFIHSSAFANYSGLPEWVSSISVFLQVGITRACIPLFFMISGALFFRNYTARSYLPKLKSRMHSLLIPYFCWNIIMMLFTLVTTVFFSRFFIGRAPFDSSVRGIAEGLFHWKYNNPFWFLMTLMIYAAAAPLLDVMLRTPAMAIVSISAWFVLMHFGITLPETLVHDTRSIIYYLAGGMLGRFCWPQISSPSPRKLRLPALIVSVLGIAETMAICNELSDPPEAAWAALLFIWAAAIWICADWACERVKARNFMTRSFMVFAMHMNVSAVITKLLVLVFPRHWTMALPVFFLSVCLTLFAIECICLFLRRFFPVPYRILSGDR